MQCNTVVGTIAIFYSDSEHLYIVLNVKRTKNRTMKKATREGAAGKTTLSIVIIEILNEIRIFASEYTRTMRVGWCALILSKGCGDTRIVSVAEGRE